MAESLRKPYMAPVFDALQGRYAVTAAAGGREQAYGKAMDVLARRYPADDGGVDRLPHGASKPRVAAFPQRCRGFADEQRVNQEQLVLACPDAAVVLGDVVVESQQAAAGLRRRGRQHGATPGSHQDCTTEFHG